MMLCGMLLGTEIIRILGQLKTSKETVLSSPLTWLLAEVCFRSEAQLFSSSEFSDKEHPTSSLVSQHCVLLAERKKLLP